MKKVITYGSFDLFHEGHYKLLKRAKALGDYLIVGVTTEHFDTMRGKLNLVDPIMTRIENVRATGFADEIIVEDHDGQKIEDIQKFGVDVFTVGSDWTGKFDYLNAYCQVIYLERTPDISSSLIRQGLGTVTRIGIIGTGRVAPRFFEESSYVSGAEVVAAFNPEVDSAMEFNERYQLPTYVDNFDKFLKKVDAIYVASPNETHADYVRKGLESGKHVLCEKPMTFTYDEAIELYDMAKEKGLKLMEGIRAAYLPAFQQIIATAKDGTIGQICNIEASFSRLPAIGSREQCDYKYSGAFLEYGSYGMLPIFKLLGVDYKDVEIESILGENGIDIYTEVRFKYDGCLATAKAGAGVKTEGQLIISGTKGYILVPSPWWLADSFE
ncbi:MAG: Gfo/Idh/MocA family oxidoreductase, partial [Pseudobutyrivibrio sp.]|nr:Gfo/Idh/MocA family oxidoreductase [Pseudobutyrivibrio sp.]